jgi:hypothetical protein
MTNKNKVKLHVGYVGITRNGKRMEIDSSNYDPEYPFKSGFYTYRRNGDYWSRSTRISNLDIMGPWVEKVKEEEEETGNYNDGNWHRWHGGERPVHKKTEVETILAFNNQPVKGLAEVFSWNHDMDPILTFRVDKEYVEPVKPQEFWVSNNDGYAHDSLESVLEDPFTEKYGYTHVREV